jgi:hypothetical protein
MKETMMMTMTFGRNDDADNLGSLCLMQSVHSLALYFLPGKIIMPRHARIMIKTYHFWGKLKCTNDHLVPGARSMDMQIH